MRPIDDRVWTISNYTVASVAAMHFARLSPPIHHPSYCDAVRPRIWGISLGRASSPDRRVR
ncbi:MAG: hypothetical protein WDZ60_00930, partial [Wenzhouxiangellaceae bacterium]